MKRLRLSKAAIIIKNPPESRPINIAISAIGYVNFFRNKQRDGYWRIYGLLNRENIAVSEKIVRQIMREEGLIVILKWRKKQLLSGEISPPMLNEIERDFHADKTNQKWLTDITELALPAGKVYLSALVDCSDDLLTGRTISITSDSMLVNTMLESAISHLSEGVHLLTHFDRDCHYRWPGWIERMKNADLKRSMSKKCCSPDNSACEGLFRCLKTEMFYNQDWTSIKISELIDILSEYLL